MSFVISFPVTGTYDGSTISFTHEIMYSDRNLQGFTHSYQMIDYKTFQSVWSDHLETIGFNPFSKLQFYITNYYPNVSTMTVDSNLQTIMNTVDVNYIFWPTNTGNQKVSDEICNGVNLGAMAIPGGYYSESDIRFTGTSPSSSINFYIGGGQISISYSFYFTPERAYDRGSFISLYTTNGCYASGYIVMQKDSYGNYYVTTSQLSTSSSTPAGYDVWYRKLEQAAPEDLNYSDPYDPYDDGHPSGTGGGDGSGGSGSGSETIEKVEFADIPNISAISTGLITVYNPSLSQIQALGSYLWSNQFDITTFKKLFSDPMEAIIGCSIVPVNPTLGGTKSVKVGDVDTGVSMPYVSSQFVQKDFGSVSIKKDIGCFLDYTQTTIQIYLPYIGIHSLAADDVMGETISLRYNIDVLTGGCSAQLYCGSKGVLYQFNGSCIANIPLTAVNYSGAIQNAVSAIASIGSTVLGAATGMAPLTMVGISGIASTASNVATHNKPQFQRSGNMGGSAGLMSVQTPYIIITRPKKSVPSKMNKFIGNTLNVTKNLGTLQGFTVVDYIHLDGIPAMEQEKQELESLLKKGVIF